MFLYDNHFVLYVDFLTGIYIRPAAAVPVVVSFVAVKDDGDHPLHLCLKKPLSYTSP